MPKDRKGRKRPADVIGNAVLVMKIATGEVKEPPEARGRQGGRKGGPERARRLTDRERSEIAQVAAAARWKKP